MLILFIIFFLHNLFFFEKEDLYLDAKLCAYFLLFSKFNVGKEEMLRHLKDPIHFDRKLNLYAINHYYFSFFYYIKFKTPIENIKIYQ